MYEEKFVLLENREMMLNELAAELESITGYTVTDSFGNIDRVVAQKPNFEDDFETYLVTYHFNETKDFVDATVTLPKDTDVDMRRIPVKIRLLSYQSREV